MKNQQLIKLKNINFENNTEFEFYQEFSNTQGELDQENNGNRLTKDYSFSIVFAQTNYVNQYVLISGGNFLAPGNRVKVGVVHGDKLTYIDSVYGDFSNVVKTSNSHPHSLQLNA